MAHPLLEYIFNKDPIHAKKLKKNLFSTPNLEKDLEIFLEKYNPFLKTNSITFENLADAYLSMVDQMCAARIDFVRSGKYPTESHSTAVEEVYSNKKIMSQYMIGLGVSQFLWKHHYALFSFYRESVKELKNVERCLEVGSGHGLFLLELLEQHPQVKTIDVVDISETSLEITENLIRTLLPAALRSVHFVHSDIEKYQAEKTYDFVTIGEVLEHVHRPKDIMKSLWRLLAKDGKVYISTCVNCPTIDHIYHFRSIQEVQDLLKESGFDIISEVIAPSEDVSPEKLEEYKLDISYGALLQKR